jgi:predicted dehydrogenase
MSQAQQPVTCVVVGAGHRALTYASYARTHPDQLRIVGVAEPNPDRRRHVAGLYDIPPHRCFESAESLTSEPLFADAAINGTMDRQHVPTSLPLLAAGYHLLLEKPFAVSEQEMWDLRSAARRNERIVMICHVLRYAAFYARIRQMVAEGCIGQILNLQTTEHVSYHHMAVAFVRGKWNSIERCGSSILMSKCCHDLDLLAWMKSGVDPVRVSSFGQLTYFRPDRAPAGAGTRCVVDCDIEAQCLYSARKHYLDHPRRWSFYVWDQLEHIDKPIDEQRAELLTTGPYGRCVWKCDNDVVDHQSVNVEFADGATATHNLVGGAARPARSIHLLGTDGEIQGVLSDSRFVVRRIDPRPGHEYSEEEVDLRVRGDMDGAFGGHGGGDLRLVADFCRVLRGEKPSISCTTIEDSINGHLVGFRADRAMQAGVVETLSRPTVDRGMR